MTYRHVLYEVDGPVAIITLNRPEVLNAITQALETELHAALDQADADPVVRAIIVTGAGRAFSSGYDMGSPERDKDPNPWPADPSGYRMDEFVSYWDRNDSGDIDRLLHLWRLAKPVIAAVHGWALGGGFWYQLAADITIAADDAVFGQPEVRHTANTTFLFAALCGWKTANRFALTGDHIDAAEAHRIGLVNEVVPAARLLPRARELAQRISMVPEASVRLNKAITMRGLLAAGIQAGMLLNGPLSAMAHSSFGSDRERLMRALREGGTSAYLRARDGPFLPEPFGPRSAPQSRRNAGP